MRFSRVRPLRFKLLCSLALIATVVGSLPSAAQSSLRSESASTADSTTREQAGPDRGTSPGTTAAAKLETPTEGTPQTNLGPRRTDLHRTTAATDQDRAGSDEASSTLGSPCTMDTYCVRERPEYPKFADIAAGSEQTCGLTHDGSVQCWGSAIYSSTATKYSVIDEHGGRTCGLRHDGAIFCWVGHGAFQLQNPPIEWGAELRQDGRYQQITVSRDVVCTLDRERHAQCWPITLRSWESWKHYDEASQAVRSQLPLDDHFVAIDAGAGHVCGIREDSTVICWGGNDAGQLDVPAHTSLVHIAAGTAHTCALDVEGRAVCWGDNHFGQSSPPSDNRFSQLTAGELHTCGLQPDGAVLCWGSNVDGQTTPPSGAVFSKLSAGAHHTCGLTATGEARCWGLNAHGQAEPSPLSARFVRLFVAGLSEGGYGYPVACGIRDGGLAQCWGRDHDPSQPASDDAHFSEIAIGGEYACGLLWNGSVSCWRHRHDDSRPHTSAITSMPPRSPRFTNIEFSGRRLCGVTTEREIACWNLDPTSAAIVTRFAPPGEQVAVEFTGHNACSLSATGSIECWSLSDDRQFVREFERAGDLLHGITAIGEHFEFKSAFGAQFTQLALSNGTHAGYHLCALRQDYTVSCWGSDGFGQASPPTAVRFRSIVAGGRHNCGITAEGHARCWGADEDGQSSPPHDEIFVELVAEFDSTCGLRAAGDVICWGEHELFAPVQLVPFDVNLPMWHSADIKALDRLGVFDGTECTTQRFCTDGPLSRAALAVWLDRLIGTALSSAVPDASTLTHWDDVNADVWWADHARKLVAADVMRPCDAENRTFCPDDPVIRDELKLILERALDAGAPSDPQASTPIAVANATAAVGADVLGMCVGRSPEACHQGVMTRGQAATVLNRFRRHLRELDRPEFTSASGANSGGCGSRADGSVECWGYDWTGEAHVPTSARVLDVYWDGTLWCGTTVDRDRICSGWDGGYGHTHVAASVSSARRMDTSIGLYHSCALLADQSIECITASFVSTADGPLLDPDVPEGKFKAVAVGIGYSCALRLGGSPVCWGDDGSGETSPPQNARYTALALGALHSCGLHADGTPECWGYDKDGRLTPPTTAFGFEGPNDSVNEAAVEPPPLALKDIAAGNSFTCGLTLEGLLACWGDLERAQPPADVVGQVFTSISAVGNYVCVERPEGGRRCWGSGSFRRSLDIDAGFIEVSANEEFTCGRRTDGSVQCWGGQFGIRPPNAPERQGITSITVGSSFACSRTGDGARQCWTLDAERDVPVGATREDFVEFSDSGHHSCALDSEGAVTCWGGNDSGEAMPPDGDYVQVSAGTVSDYRQGGWHHLGQTCAVDISGSIRCWGDNSRGQSSPPAGNDFVRVAASGVHACGLRTNGKIECWGQRLLHDEEPSPTQRYSDVVVGAGGGNWPSYEDDGGVVYSAHTCGLRIDGVVDCWGSVYTPNKPYNRHEPDPRSRFTSISSGRGHVCGVRTDGAIECWGIPGFVAY